MDWQYQIWTESFSFFFLCCFNKYIRTSPSFSPVWSKAKYTTESDLSPIKKVNSGLLAHHSRLLARVDSLGSHVEQRDVRSSLRFEPNPTMKQNLSCIQPSLWREGGTLWNTNDCMRAILQNGGYASQGELFTAGTVYTAKQGKMSTVVSTQ